MLHSIKAAKSRDTTQEVILVEKKSAERGTPLGNGGGGHLEPGATGCPSGGAVYSGQGCRCSLEETTFPSLISSVMVRI